MGVVSVSSATPLTASAVLSAVQSVAESSLLKTAVRTAVRVNPYLNMALTAYDVGTAIYKAVSDSSLPSISVVKNIGESSPVVSTSTGSVSQTVEKLGDTELSSIYTSVKDSQLQNVGTTTQKIEDSLSVTVDTTLPEVMRSNTLALTQSVNTLSSVMAQSLADISSSLFAINLNLSNLVDLKQTHNENYMQVESVKLEREIAHTESLTFQKTVTEVYDLEGQHIASVSPRDIADLS